MSLTTTIYVDGATAGGRHSGVAAVARTAEGDFVGWYSQRLPRMTNNEAEYHAALLGLELAAQLVAQRVEIVSDSEVMVRQMQGHSQVNSSRLQRLHKQTCQAVRRFEQVTFRHVLREENHLADALAAEALQGKLVRTSTAAASPGAPATAGRRWPRLRHLLKRG